MAFSDRWNQSIQANLINPKFMFGLYNKFK